MENKYYIPEISEFHIGFRYERLFDDKWLKQECGLHNVDLPGKMLRVNFLDSEDIIELGWKETSSHSNIYQFKVNDDMIFELMDYKNDNHIEIQGYSNMKGMKQKLFPDKEFTKRQVTIDNKDNWCRNSLCFRGTIRNFNELQDVMRMLKINSDGK